MTTEKKVARRKLTLLELAGQLGNVSKACRIVGLPPLSRARVNPAARRSRPVARSAAISKFLWLTPLQPRVDDSASLDCRCVQAGGAISVTFEK